MSQQRLEALEKEIMTACDKAEVDYRIKHYDYQLRKKWDWNVETGYHRHGHVYGEMRGQDVLARMLDGYNDLCPWCKIEFMVQPADDAPGFTVFYNFI